MPRATIRDVARVAGVSVSTASRALNDRHDVSAATRARVLAAAERLNYVPSSVARGLISGRSGALGVVITSIASPVYSLCLQGIEAAARAAGYTVLLCSSEDSQESALDCLARLVSNQVEGIILTPVGSDRRDIEWLESRNVPFVQLFRRFPDLDADFVTPDHAEGGRLVTGHLLDLGHIRIGHVGGPAHTESGQGRLAGYHEALSRAGIPADDELIVSAPFTVAGGYVAAGRLLDRADRPTAIFAATDLQAVGVLKAARERRLRVPEDLAVAGGDNIELAEHLQTPLTTFDSSASLVGSRAAEIIIARLNGTWAEPQRIVLGTSLLVRASSGGRR